MRLDPHPGMRACEASEHFRRPTSKSVGERTRYGNRGKASVDQPTLARRAGRYVGYVTNLRVFVSGGHVRTTKVAVSAVWCGRRHPPRDRRDAR